MRGKRGEEGTEDEKERKERGKRGEERTEDEKERKERGKRGEERTEDEKERKERGKRGEERTEDEKERKERIHNPHAYGGGTRTEKAHKSNGASKHIDHTNTPPTAKTTSINLYSQQIFNPPHNF